MFIVAGAMMLSMELDLAVKVPHDVVLLDRSLLTPLIRFNQEIRKLPDVPHELAKLFSKKGCHVCPSRLPRDFDSRKTRSHFPHELAPLFLLWCK